MNQSPPDLHGTIADAGWFAHRYDAVADAIQLRRLDRDDHRRVTFLTDGEIGEVPMRVVGRARGGRCRAGAGAAAAALHLPFGLLLFDHAGAGVRPAGRGDGL